MSQIQPATVTQAFTQSGARTLNAGVEIQPYSPSRVVAAQAMGLKYPNIGPDSLEAFNKTGIYPGALQDVLIVLWLCSIADDKEVTRALRAPDDALSKAIAWGATQGIIDTKSDAWWAAYNVFIDIMVEINASRGDPQLPDSPQDDDTEDPND